MDLEKRALAADLVHEFCWRADTGAGSDIAELFVDDALIVSPHFRLEGRAEIHAWFSERAKPGARIARHIVSNLRFAERDDGQLEVTAYSTVMLLLPSGDASRVALGTSRDLVEFREGRALFKRRDLEVAFEARMEVPGV